jgi:hypothetical protein
VNPIFFCFFIFVNLRDGEKNPKKQIPKKKDKKRSKYDRTDGRTDERTQRGVAESASQITGSKHAKAGKGRFCR